MQEKNKSNKRYTNSYYNRSRDNITTNYVYNHKHSRPMDKYEYNLLWTCIWLFFVALFCVLFHSPWYLAMLFFWFTGCDYKY